MARALGSIRSRGHRAGGSRDLAQLPVAGAQPGIPVFLVNARLSDRSYRSYRRFGFLFRPLFAAARRRRRAERSRRRTPARTGLPARGGACRRQPQIRRRTAGRAPAAGRAAPCSSNSACRSGRPVLVAGSTHAGEEAILAEQFSALARAVSGPVSRPGARGTSNAAGEVGRRIGTAGVRFVYRSEVTASACSRAGRSGLPAGQQHRAS
ncbi:MAG: hypothetical protein M0C28_13690 [Candidatus Moduliflexus flocculans]|nr:hypothetical protein [Candidatus Moduliflexus flocculans]